MPAQPKTTLEQLLHHLGFAQVTIEEHHLEEGLLLDVKSDDAGRLIGRQGQTLSELQYILNRLLFHQDPAAPKVMPVPRPRNNARFGDRCSNNGMCA